MLEAAPPRRRFPISEALLWLCVCGPPLALGGIWPPLLPLFAVAVLALALRLISRMSGGLRIPRGAWIGLLGASLCLLAWAPLGPRAVGLLAPGLAEATEHALTGTQLGRWPRVTLVPGATLQEAARLTLLMVLFVCAAQLRWRHTAAAVAVAGTLVAVTGLVHEALGLDAILGLYQPRDRGTGSILTTFVNPNHQSSLLLLGSACAGAMALEEQRASRSSRSSRGALDASHRALFFGAALLLQVAVLLLTLSRGALLTFALLAPYVAWTLWRGRAELGDAEELRRRRVGLAALSAGVLLLVAVAGRRTLDELRTLWSPEESEAKLRVARDGLALIRDSPVLGIGRGSFVDAFPLVDTQPGELLFTHLESAPIAMLVEWGPIGGGAMVLGLAWWWISAMRGSSETPRRVALIGLLAVALHATTDFALEYLGVAAPAVALAGALSPTRDERWPQRRALIVACLLCVGGGVTAQLGGPHGLVGRREANDAVARGAIAPDVALGHRPLDAQLHLRLARLAAARDDLEALAHHAEVLTWLRPTTVEGWLMRASVAGRSGRAEDAARFVRRGLAALRRPPDAELVAYLTSLGSPTELAQVAPLDGEAWRHLMDGLLLHAPAHADAVARERERQRPYDADALVYRVRAALALERAQLALHLARQLCDSAPQRAQSWSLLARSQRAAGGPDIELEVQAELAKALGDPEALDDPALVEELMLSSLMRTAETRAELEAALELAERLVERPADRPTLRRREQRVISLRARLGLR